MTTCPYCEKEMECKFGETKELDYHEETKRTNWHFTELWVCYDCPGPDEEE